MMSLLRTFTKPYNPDDIYEGDLPDGPVYEDIIDCTPDSFDDDDGITAVDKAVEALEKEGLTEASSSPVPRNPGNIWFVSPDGDQPHGWDGHYTGMREQKSAHPEGFTPYDIFIIAKRLGNRMEDN